MMRFVLEDLQAVAMNAFDEMEALALKGEFDTATFTEPELVFQVGALLIRGAITQGAPLLTRFEYPVPNTKQSCDLVVCERRGPSDERRGWLEVKKTGIRPTGGVDNQFGDFPWRDDFRKLGGIEEKTQYGQNKCAWIWLYQSKDFRAEIDKAFGTESHWSLPKRPSECPNCFGQPTDGKVGLQRLLLEIENASSGILMSVRPRVRTRCQGKDDWARYQGINYSALIITAMVPAAKRGSSGEHPLHGTVLHYDRPTEPVAEADWGVLQ